MKQCLLFFWKMTFWVFTSFPVRAQFWQYCSSRSRCCSALPSAAPAHLHCCHLTSSHAFSFSPSLSSLSLFLSLSLSHCSHPEFLSQTPPLPAKGRGIFRMVHVIRARLVAWFGGGASPLYPRPSRFFQPDGRPAAPSSLSLPLCHPSVLTCFSTEAPLLICRLCGSHHM